MGVVVFAAASCGGASIRTEAGTGAAAEQGAGSGQAPRTNASLPGTEPARPAGEQAAAVGAGGQPPAPVAEAAKPPAAEPAQPPPIPPGTAVLHIGDSFALAGFSQALRPKMKALQVRYEVRSEQSSYTVSWAPKMELLLANTQPDLVIINLGANEVANINPPAHGPAIRRISQLMGDRPCVWVSPPLWRKDTGIIDVIRENSAPCRFFDSDVLVPGPIPRQADKIHPNDEGGQLWADTFWAWLHAERAPADEKTTELGKTRPSPWRLKPSPPEEHLPRKQLKADR